VSARPLRADDATELSEILEFTADMLDDGGSGVLADAGMDLSELRSTLLGWSMRLLDTPADAGSHEDP
jgi:hypothetical protein